MERILNDGETWEDAARRLDAENKTLHTALGSYEGPDDQDIPYEKRDLITLDLAKLWTVRIRPSMGQKAVAEQALKDLSIQPVDWESGGLILLPPMKDETHVTPVFDIVKRSIEENKTKRTEYFWPYGMKG